MESPTVHRSKLERFSVSRKVPPFRPGSTAKPIPEKYPSHGIPIAIFSVFGAASPKVSLLLFSHGPDFRIRLVAGSCLYRVSQPLQGSYWSSLPGFHLSRCQAGSSAFSPSLFGWFPFPRWGVGSFRYCARLAVGSRCGSSFDFP